LCLCLSNSWNQELDKQTHPEDEHFNRWIGNILNKGHRTVHRKFKWRFLRISNIEIIARFIASSKKDSYVHKMPKVKNFRELSRRQKNRQLKQIHISENFVPEIVYNLNKKANYYLKNSNQKASNFLLVQKTSNHIFIYSFSICSW